MCDGVQLHVELARHLKQPVVAGQAVEGTVRVEWEERFEGELPAGAAKALLDIHGLTLSLVGEERVASRESGTAPITDRFLSVSIPLLSSATTLPEGESQEFPFSAVLPAQLCPASCHAKLEDGRTISIKYHMSAKLLASPHGNDATPTDHESQPTSFLVAEAFQSQLHPVSGEAESNGVHLMLQIPQQAFALGEPVPMKVTVSGAHRTKVVHLTSLLTRIITARHDAPGSPRRAAGEAPEKQQVLRRVFALSGRDESTVFDCDLETSAETESSVMGRLIQVSYEAEVVAHIAAGIPQELRVAIPLLMCSPRALSPLVESASGQMDAAEFSVVADDAAGAAKHLRLIPEVSVGGTVFYRKPEVMFYDIQPGSRVMEVVLRAQGSKKLLIQGRFGEEPTVFAPGTAACELPGQRYVWRIAGNKMFHEGRLAPGRWYFAVAGGSLLQTSEYKMKLSVELKKTEEEERAEKKDRVTEVVIENQGRSSPFGDYTINNLVPREGGKETPLWATRTGDKSPCKEDISLPDATWFWADKAWKNAFPAEARDDDGWQYASHWEAGQWKAKSNLMSRVRRRAWSRVRCVKPDGYVTPEEDLEGDLADLLDEFEVLPDTAQRAPIFIDPDVDPEEDANAGPSLRSSAEVQGEDPEDDGDVFYSQSGVIERQEQADAERRERESTLFQQMEAERRERATKQAEQRESERQKVAAVWEEQQEQLRQQLERDKARLLLLQSGSGDTVQLPAHQEDEAEQESENEVPEESLVADQPEEPEPPVAQPLPTTFVTSAVEELDFSDDDFEPVDD